MSNAVATVAFLQGQAWAKSPDGSLRPLSVGSVLNADEILVTAQGAKVELDTGDGQLLSVQGGQEVAMNRDLNPETATSPDEALLSDASVQEALTVLEQGGDLTTELEETAAGNTGGGGSEGHGFVQLTRLIEATDPLAFSFDAANAGGAGAPNADAEFPRNNPPEVVDQQLVFDEDTVLNGQIIATDVENDTLTYAVLTAPTNGVLTLDPVTGAFTFTPNENYNGADSFVVTVTDDAGNSVNNTITLSITAVNDAPVSSAQPVVTNEDTPVTGQVVATDVENDVLSFAVTTNPANGVVTINAATGAYEYTPNPNFYGLDSFVVTVADGNGGISLSTVSVTINPVNDAPVATNQNLTTAEDTPINGQIVASDVDNDPLTYTVTTNPMNGSLLFNANGSFTYTPNPNYNGNDSFVVTVSDGFGGVTTSTISIGVTPVNDAPVAANRTLNVAEDTQDAALNIAAPSDVDGDTLTITVAGLPSVGTVTLADGTPVTNGQVLTAQELTGLRFDAPANVNSIETGLFQYSVSDGQETVMGTITINVTPANDAPVTSNQTVTTDEDTAYVGQIVATDIDGDTLSYSINSMPTNGVLSVNPITGQFTYTPNLNYNGGDSFSVLVSDGRGGIVTSVVTVGVTPVNDAPIANPDLASTPINQAVTVDVRANDTDVDNLRADLVVSNPQVDAAQGTATLDAQGRVVFTPALNFSGVANITYTLTDPAGLTSTGNLTVNVGANTAPTGADNVITLNEDGSHIFAANNFGFADADAAQTLSAIRIDTLPAAGSLTLGGVAVTAGQIIPVAALATLVFTPAPDANGNNYASFTFSVQDSVGAFDLVPNTIQLNVTPVNDAPIAQPAAFAVAEDAAIVTGNLIATDIDAGAVLTYTINVAAPAGFTFNSDGSYSFDASNAAYQSLGVGQQTVLTIPYTVTDDQGATSVANLVITVTGTNDAPVAQAASFTVAEDAATVTGNVTANDIDANATHTYALNNAAPAGLTFNVDGSYSFDATNAAYQSLGVGQQIILTVPYTVTDDQGATSTADLVITVTGTNDAPVAQAASFTVAEDAAIVNGNVTANDIDANATHTYALNIAAPAGLTFNANGSYSFDATNAAYQSLGVGQQTVLTIPYTVTDDQGATSVANLEITVTGTNDGPVANADLASTNINTDVVIDVRANDSDIDNLLTDLVVSNPQVDPAQGTVTLDAQGRVVFTPALNFSGMATITYTLTDPSGAPATGTVTVNVGNNTAPTGTDNVITLNEDGSHTFAASEFGFADADALQTFNAVRIDTLPAAGTFTLGGVAVTAGQIIPAASLGTLVFTPATNANGNNYANFTFSVQDSAGGFDLIPNTIQLDVTPVNDAPSANGMNLNGTEDNNLAINLSGNDIDGTVQLVQLISLPTAAQGVLYLADGVTAVTTAMNLTVAEASSLIFTPAVNFNGNVSFNFTVTDNDGAPSLPATVNIAIAAVNDAPDTAIVNVSGNEDTAITITLSGSDIDGSVTGYAIKTLPANGTLFSDAAMTNAISVNDIVTGPVYFLPATNWNGTTNFDYAAVDNAGLEDLTPAAVNITVNPVNDAPIAVDDPKNLGPSTQLGLSSEYFGYREGVDGGNLIDITTVANFISGRTPDATFTATQFQYGTDNLFNDDLGFGNNLQTFLGADAASLSADPTNTSDAIIRMSGYVELNAGTYNFRVLGDDGYQIKIDGQIVAEINGIQPPTGTVHTPFTLATSGYHQIEIIYWDQAGRAVFQVEISDDAGLNYQLLNQIPTANSGFYTTNEDTPLVLSSSALLLNDSDIDTGDLLSIVSVDNAVNGSVSIAGNGDITFVPAANYFGSASFEYTVSDGNGGTDVATVSLYVSSVNDAPVANTDVASTAINTAVVIDVRANDSDIDNVQTDLVVSNPQVNIAQGTATLDAQGRVVFTPALNFSGTATITYTLTDPSGAQATGTVTVNVDANTAPTGADNVITLNEDGSHTFSASEFGFVDADLGQTFAAVRIDTLPTAGALTLNGFAVTQNQIISVADLTNLAFTPANNANGNNYANFTFSVQDSAGSFDLVPNAIQLDVIAVNDAPVNQLPTAQVTNEDTALVFSAGNGNQIQISDLDAGLSNVEVTLSVNNGTLTLASITGLVFVTGDGTADSNLVFSGSLVDINNALATLTFNPTANYNGPAVLSITTSDLGSTGSGGVLTDTDTINITVNPANDTPTIFAQIPDQNATEDSAFNFQFASNSFADVDAGDVITYSAQLAGGGALPSWLVFDSVTRTFSGTPANGDVGTVSIDVIANDGNGGTVTDTFNIVIGGVNDAPINTAPSSIMMNEDTTQAITGLSISDVDSASGNLTVTLQITNGILNVSGGTAVITGNGTNSVTLTGTQAEINSTLSATVNYVPTTNFNGTSTLTITTNDNGNSGAGGALTDVDTVTITVNPVNDAPTIFAQIPDQNATEDAAFNFQFASNSFADVDAGDVLTYTAQLAGGGALPSWLIFDSVTRTFSGTPTNDDVGTVSIDVIANDGNGGAVTDTFNIVIGGVNDAPVNNGPLSITTSEDTVTAISGLSVSDVDAGSTSILTVTMTVVNGTLNVSGGSATIVGDGSSTVTLTGTLAEINSTLASTVNYIPTNNYNGVASFTMVTNDNGNTGAGGPASGSRVIPITVTPVNDAPVNSIPAAQVTSEDTALIFSGANRIQISDIDASPSSNLEVTLSVTNGSLALGSLAGLTFTSGSNGSAALTVTGSLININNALSTVTFTPANNYNGNAVLSITTNDLGNTGAGGAQISTNTINIAITAVNDAPVNNGPASITTSEDTVTAISGLSVSDVDAVPAAILTVTMTVINGTLNVSGGTATIVGDGSSTVTLTGTIAEINSTLAATVNYIPTTNYNGAAQFIMVTNDNGSSGAGGSAVGSRTIPITVTPVNDAPVNTIPSPITTSEDTVTAINGLSVSDVDAGNLTVTLQITNGILNVSGGSAAISGNGTDTVTLTGTPAQINSTLAATVNYVPSNNFHGASTLTITTNDNGNTGAGGPLTATNVLAITVNPVNDGSVANQIVSTNEDTVLNGNLPTTDADGAVTYAVITNQATTNGTVSVAANGSYVYTPNVNYFGSDSFVVDVTDAQSFTTQVTVDITVNSINDVPVAQALNLNGTEDNNLVVNLSGSDIDGVVQSIQLISLPTIAQGVLYLADGVTPVTTAMNLTTAQAANLIFTPAANFNGNLSFNFTVTDNSGTASLPATVSIGIASVNDAPDTAIVNASGNEDTTITITLSGSDIDGSVAGYAIKTLPANGTLFSDAALTTSISVNDVVTGPVYFSPANNWSGTTNFNYAAVDNLGAEDATPAAVNITVNPVNDAPVTTTANVTVNEEVQNTALGIVAPTDVDSASLTITVSGLPSVGVVTLANGTAVTVGQSLTIAELTSLQYDAPMDVLTATNTSFTYSVSDGSLSTTGTANITVNPVNDAPIANDDPEPSLATTPVGLLSEYYGYNEGPDGGNLLNIPQVLSFINGRTPDATFTATEFRYGLDDLFFTDLGNGTNLQSFLGADAASLSADPGTTSDAVIRMRGYVELDAGTYNFRVRGDDGYQIKIDGLVVAEVNGIQSPTGTVHTTFTVAESGFHQIEVLYWDQGGQAVFQAEISNNSGSTYQFLSQLPTVSTGVFSLQEDNVLTIAPSSLLANDSDIDGNTLSVFSVGNPTHGSVSINGSGDIIFTPQLNYSGPASFEYTVSDGNGGTDVAKVAIFISPVNDAPTLVVDNFTTNEDAALTLTPSQLLTNDSDIENDILTISSAQGAVNGSVALVAGNVVFTPTANYNGPASFTYTVSDGNGGSSTQTVNVTVNSVNDAPAGSNQAVSIVEDKAYTLNASNFGFSDVDGNSLSAVRITTLPAAGTLLLNNVAVATNASITVADINAGRLTYVPANNSITSRSFTFQVQDDGGTTNGGVNLDQSANTFTFNITTDTTDLTGNGSSNTHTIALNTGTVSISDSGGANDAISATTTGAPTFSTFNFERFGSNLEYQATSGANNVHATILNEYVAANKVETITFSGSGNYSGYLLGNTAYTINTTSTGVSGTREILAGSAADDTLTGGGGTSSDMLFGGAGNDTLTTTGSGTHLLVGGSGNDTLTGGTGVDVLLGGSGNDSLTGGAGADVFVWKLSDKGTAGSPATDTVTDFTESATDRLNISDLLQGENSGTLTNYLHFTYDSGTNATTVHISSAGGYSSGFSNSVTDQTIVLSGYNPGANPDATIISNLIAAGKLITD